MQQAVDEAGNVWNVDANGNAVSLARPAGQSGGGSQRVQVRPSDPKQPYVAPQAGADLRSTNLTNQQKEIEIRDATQGQLPPGYRWGVGPDGKPMAERIPGLPPPGGAGASSPQSLADIKTVIDQINHIEALFNKYQKGVGAGSILEYLPTQGNRAFDTAGAQLADLGTAAFRKPGLGSQSDADAARFVQANQPSRWDSDSQVIEKLNALRRRVDNSLAASGQPAAQWGAQYDPSQEEQQGIPGAYLPNGGAPGGPQGPTVLPDARGARGDNVRVGDESGVTSAGNGLMREPRLAGVGQELLAMVQAGRSRKDVFGYADKRFREVGFPGISPGQSKALDYAIRMRAANPSKPVTNFVTGWENYEMVPDTNSGAGARAMGAVATFDPGGVPVGNTLTHFTNAATAGLPTYMAGDNGADVMAASRRTMPISSLVGDVGGNLAAMAGINKLGGLLSASGRPGIAMVGNALTKSGGVGGDIAYGTVRGGLEHGPEGAVLGATGALVGNKVGGGVVNTVGRGVRGVSNSAVDYLSSRGIPLTTGQLLGNRSVAGRVMNKLESMPILGDSMAARRAESMAAYNRAALEDAGSRINFTPTDTGYKGVELGLDAAGNAIENAVSGVDVPIDPTARADIANVIGDAQRTLTPDYAQKYAQVVGNRVNPAISGPNITGEAYQQAMRGLKRYRAGAGSDGFEQDFRDSLTSMGDALTDNITRQAGPEVAQNLGKANQAYRDFSLIQKATEKAQSGNQSGLPEIFTPSQLQQAVRSSKYAKSGSSEPFYDLNTAAQDILPSTIPNSGSADRGLASLLVPAGLTGGAAAASYYDPKIAAPLAAIALLTTKGGAKLAQKALTGRSAAAKALGTKIIQQRRKAGLFGASAGVSMLPQFSQ